MREHNRHVAFDMHHSVHHCRMAAALHEHPGAADDPARAEVKGVGAENNLGWCKEGRA
jgi:hypothetical protein